MSAAKTAKLLNDLLASQKADRTRIKQLEARLEEANTRQAAAMTVAAAAAEMQFNGQLQRMQNEFNMQLQCAQNERAAAELQLKELAAHKDLEVENCNWQITELKQSLSSTRQILTAADASNEELRGIVEALGESLDKATQAAADVADERTAVAKQREELNHILDTVRERMRKRELADERAILNRKAIAGAAPGVNFR